MLENLFFVYTHARALSALHMQEGTRCHIGCVGFVAVDKRTAGVALVQDVLKTLRTAYTVVYG